MLRRPLRALDRHWFAPAPLRDLGVARIVLVGVQLGLLLVPALSWGACPGCRLEQQRFLAGADASLFVPIPALKVLLLPLGGWGVRPDALLLGGAWWLALCAGGAALLGWYTRPALLILAASSTLLVAHNYSYGEMHHTEAPLVVGLWILALAPSGARLSLDHVRRRARGHLGPDASPDGRWPLRLLQWFLVLVYLSAGLSKLTNGGLDWFNGHTLGFYLVTDNLRTGRELGIQLATHPQLVALLSVGAVAFELGFGLAVLVPAAAAPLLVAGLLFHASIWLVQGPPFVHWAALYVAFLPTLRARLRRRGGPARTPLGDPAA